MASATANTAMPIAIKIWKPLSFGGPEEGTVAGGAVVGWLDTLTVPPTALPIYRECVQEYSNAHSSEGAVVLSMYMQNIMLDQKDFCKSTIL